MFAVTYALTAEAVRSECIFAVAKKTGRWFYLHSSRHDLGNVLLSALKTVSPKT